MASEVDEWIRAGGTRGRRWGENALNLIMRASKLARQRVRFRPGPVPVLWVDSLGEFLNREGHTAKLPSSFLDD